MFQFPILVNLFPFAAEPLNNHNNVERLNINIPHINTFWFEIFMLSILDD